MLVNKVPLSVDPFELLASLRDRAHPFILDSALPHDRFGRYSFVGADPFLTFSSKGKAIRVCREGKEELFERDPFEVLRELLEPYKCASVPLGLPFTGGAVGFFGYDMCRFIEEVPDKAADDLGMADCFFGFYDRVFVFDHITDNLFLVAREIGYPADRAIAEMEEILNRARYGADQRPPCSIERREVEFTSNMTRDVYTAAVNRIREYIRDGDVYQVNFTERFDCEIDIDAMALYEKLHTMNPAPFAAYIDTGDGIILSSSPERFLKVSEGTIETRPIKGTIARGGTESEDDEKKQFLQASEKERAELLMIVDLERNDLGRIAKTGSVRVPELFTVETYPTLHHLVATVTAEIRPECDLIDCIRAVFPGGSITGAPKVRAMEIIDELEPTRRGVYTGSIGYLGFDGRADLNIAIRTIVVKNGRAYFQTGGGITWDSQPDSEFNESLLKAKALMAALSQ